MSRDVLFFALIVGAAGLFCLAGIKVKNELEMTKAYDRQAAALERIADAVVQR